MLLKLILTLTFVSQIPLGSANNKQFTENEISDADSTLDNIINLYSENKFIEANALTDRLIKNYPENKRTHILKAQILISLHRYSEAIETLKKVPSSERGGEFYYFKIKSLFHLKDAKRKDELSAALDKYIEEPYLSPEILSEIHTILTLQKNDALNKKFCQKRNVKKQSYLLCS